MPTIDVDAPVDAADRCGVRCVVPTLQTDAVEAARARLPGTAAMLAASEVAAMLANPTRLRLLAALLPSGDRDAPTLCVCDLSSVAGASETATSHQLRMLRLSGMVAQRREGRTVYYRMAPDVALQQAVTALLRGGPTWAR